MLPSTSTRDKTESARKVTSSRLRLAGVLRTFGCFSFISKLVIFWAFEKIIAQARDKQSSNIFFITIGFQLKIPHVLDNYFFFKLQLDKLSVTGA